MSWRAEVLLGYQLHPYANDPANIGVGDFLFAFCEWLVGMSIFLSCIGLPLIFAVAYTLWNRNSKGWIWLPVAIYVMGAMLVVFGPTDRWKWFFID